MPPKKSELPGSPKIQELGEEKADAPSLRPMTPESKQLAAVIATAVATARRGGTTDAKDNNVHPEAVAVHCRWRDGGTSTQDIYDARSIKRRVRVTAAMLA